jgi:acetyltransferase-like isoleucine patch superfamily enzyme
MFKFILLFLKSIIIFLPWKLKRFILIKYFKFSLHPSSYIGISWFFPNNLIMSEYSKIGHFNVAIHLDKIILNKFSTISRSNWITGFSTKTNSKHFKHQIGRSSDLIMGEHAAITKYHHIDCTSCVSIGNFTTIAGYRTQILSHSINIMENRQDSQPIIIGAYCFVGTAAIILGGAILPDYSVLGAQSFLNKSFHESYSLYGGVPAKFISKIPKEAKYFTRINGFVD